MTNLEAEFSRLPRHGQHRRVARRFACGELQCVIRSGLGKRAFLSAP